MTKHAVTRCETIADFHDIVLLLAHGYHVAVEPIAGNLSGFFKPTRLGTGGKRRGGVKNPYPARIAIEDDPASIASGYATVMRCKVALLSLSFDAPDHLDDALKGFCGLLNRRAGPRILSVTDIADLLEWAAMGLPGELELQVPYGHRSWGFFLRREGDTPIVEDWRPEAPQAVRSVICHVEPTKEDAVHMLGYRRRDGADRPPNHVTWTTRLVGCDLPKGTEERWQAMKAIGAEEVRAERPLPEGLQAHWHDAATLYRWIELVGDLDQDDRNHALHSGIKTADDLRTIRPTRV